MDWVQGLGLWTGFRVEGLGICKGNLTNVCGHIGVLSFFGGCYLRFRALDVGCSGGGKTLALGLRF